MGVGEDAPFAQWAAIDATDRFICVGPLSGYRQGFRDNEGYVIYLEPEAAEKLLGQALLEALNKSRFIYPPNEREFFEANRIISASKRWENDMMKRFKYKTRREAYKNMSYCVAERTGGTISIKPHKRHKPKPGYITDLPKDRTVVIAATTDPMVLGTALKLALSHCE